MKHILFYTDTPNYGGAERQMALLAKYLKPLGFTVSLACGNYSVLRHRKSAFGSEAVQARRELETVYNTVHFLPTIHKHDPRHYTALKKLLNERQFDLVHLHLWNPGACRYAFWAAKKAGLPVVTTEHDPFALAGMKKRIKNACIAKTDEVIAISLDNLRQLSEDGGVPKNRLHLIHNGIETDKFLDNHDKASLPVEAGDLVVTSIAELHERKGHKYLLEAFKKLQAEIPHVRLMLVGKGPAEKGLKDKYGDVPNVHFLGWREDIPQVLRASDLFVLPSLREAFGLVVAEAMASGVAVVSTDNGGPAEIIENGKSGLLVRPGNSEQLLGAMRTLLRNPDQRRDLVTAAKERVKREFSAERMAEKTVEVYKTVASASGESQVG